MTNRRSIVKKINRDNLKLCIATTDRNNPLVVYFEGRGYISPSSEKEDGYNNDILMMNKLFKSIVSHHLKTDDLFENRFIFDFEVPEKYVSFGKKSSLFFQFLLKQKNNDLYSLQELSTLSLPLINGIVDDFEKCLSDYDFKLTEKK